MTSLRVRIEAHTRTAQHALSDAVSHEAGWRQWCTALLEAHFSVRCAPDGPRTEGTTSANAAPDASRTDDSARANTALSNTASNRTASEHRTTKIPSTHLDRLAQELPHTVSDHPEVLIWAFEQWQQPRKAAAQRTPDDHPSAVAPLTQLFTDAHLAEQLISPCIEDAQRMPINALRDMRILDPCSGASSILLTLFRGLLPILMDRLEWSTARAVEHLMQHTLRGVELDALCASVGALVLSLEVHRVLRSDADADTGAWARCAAMPSPIADFECTSSAEGSQVSDRTRLWRAFGSLYDPAKHNDAATRAIDETYLQDQAPRNGTPCVNTAPLLPFALATPRGVDIASKWLRSAPTHVCTNVPFLARGKQSSALRAFCALHYPHSRYDLANVFLDRCLALVDASSGQVHVLMPQNWLFLTRYRTQRRHLLENYRWQHVHFCGEGAFESAGAAGAFVILLHMDVQPPDSSHTMRMTRKADEGFGRHDDRTVRIHRQQEFLDSPQARIVWEHASRTHPPLSERAVAYVGLQTGDDPRYIRAFWELDAPDKCTWMPLQGAPADGAFNDGNSWLVRWENGQGPLHNARGARPTQGAHAIGQLGVAIQRMRRIAAYNYSGHHFHQNIAVIVPKNDEDFSAIEAFCHAPAFEAAVRQLDQKLNVTNRTLTDVPFDIAHWRKVAKKTPIEQHPNPHPFRQRDFRGLGPARTAVHIHLARYLGMRWPDEQLSNNTEDRSPNAARLGASDDNSPWYLLLHDAPNAAPQHTSTGWMQQLAQDTQIHAELRTAVEAQSDAERRQWLREAFFEEHCALFLQRPFLWHIWDGEPDGFNVIVRYHRLDTEGLAYLIDEPLTSYRHALQHANVPSVDRQRLQAAATLLHARLSDILAGRPPYDLFVRWKSPAAQANGWAPDVNDGVRLNLRPFLSGPSLSKKGAGVLRVRPKVHFRNDRGRDSETGLWAEHNRAEGMHAGTRVNTRHADAAGDYPIKAPD